MKKTIYTLIFALLWGFSAQADSSLDQFNRPEYRIGMWKGSSFVDLVQKKLPLATPRYYKDGHKDMIEGLRKNQIDSFIADRITAVELMKENPDLTYEDTPLDQTQFAMAFHSDNQTLKEEFATVIREMKANGKLKKLQDAWFSDDSNKKISTIAPHGKRGTLRVATASVNPPFSFYLNNKLVGIEIELINQIARRLDYGVEWSVIKHDTFIEALQSKSVDVYGSLLTITPERAEKVLFGEPDYDDIVVLVKKK